MNAGSDEDDSMPSRPDFLSGKPHHWVAMNVRRWQMDDLPPVDGSSFNIDAVPSNRDWLRIMARRREQEARDEADRERFTRRHDAERDVENGRNSPETDPPRHER